MPHTRPAQPIKVNGGVLSIRAVCSAGGQGRFRGVVVNVALYIDAAVDEFVFMVRIVAVRVGACGGLGEVAIGPVEVDDLAATVRGLDGRVEVVSLFAVAHFGGLVFVVGFGGLGEGRVAVDEVGGDGLWSDGR